MAELAPELQPLTEPTALPAEGGSGSVPAAGGTASPPVSDALNLAEVPPAILAEAQRRLALVSPLLQMPRAGREVALRAAAVETGEAVRTLYRWCKAAKAAGLEGLLPHWGRTKGRFVALSTDVQDFLIHEYCQPTQPSPTTVYRRLTVLCDHLRVACPSAGTVTRFLASIPPAAVVLARVGPKAWRAGFEPKCVRDFSSLAVGAWWVADHREFDVFVRLGDADGERIARPWLTAWLDLRSRTCVGWAVSLGPNSDTIACALRDGILRYGLPQHLYRDNGKDFTCHYWGGKTRVIKGAALPQDAMALLGPLGPLGIRTHEATPYTPWAKPIEGWFGGTFPEWEKTLPGWCGKDAKQRPEKLAREIQDGELLPFDEFVDRVAECLDLYHHRQQDGLDGSPLDLWRGVTIERPDPRTLDVLLMRGGKAVVTSRGIARFGRHFWHDRLIDVVGQKLDYRYDPNRIGALVCFREGKFFCEATHAPTLTMGASEADLKELHRKKRLAKQRAQAALDDRKVLLRPERVLAEITAKRRADKVCVLHPTPPRGGDPARPALPPGAAAISKVVPAFDHAAQALAAARYNDRPQALPAPVAPDVANPPSAPPFCVEPESDSGLCELLTEEPRRAEARSDRDTLLKELLG